MLISLMLGIRTVAQPPALQAQISLPAPPTPILPPGQPRGPRARPSGDRDSHMPEALRKRREQRQLEEKALAPKEPTAMEKQKEQLKEESAKPRPFNFMAAIDFVYPKITVSGDRKDYTADPTAHHYGLFRFSGGANDGGATAWIGYRIASFSGSGAHEGTYGRYGFTYIGPMIAVGKFSSGVRSVGQTDSDSDEDSSGDELGSRHGLLLGVGLSTLVSNGSTANDADDPPDDLRSQSGAFDSPGLNAQLEYIHVLYGAVGVNYVAGVQLGKGKSFYWAGIGVSGFH